MQIHNAGYRWWSKPASLPVAFSRGLLSWPSVPLHLQCASCILCKAFPCPCPKMHSGQGLGGAPVVAWRIGTLVQPNTHNHCFGDPLSRGYVAILDSSSCWTPLAGMSLFGIWGLTIHKCMYTCFMFTQFSRFPLLQSVFLCPPILHVLVQL